MRTRIYYVALNTLTLQGTALTGLFPRGKENNVTQTMTVHQMMVQLSRAANAVGIQRKTDTVTFYLGMTSG